jgi:hypothetical protein
MIYVSRNGQHLGAFPESEVIDGLRSSRFLRSDLAWYAGLPDWIELSALASLPPDPAFIRGPIPFRESHHQAAAPDPSQSKRKRSTPIVAITVLVLLMVFAMTGKIIRDRQKAAAEAEQKALIARISNNRPPPTPIVQPPEPAEGGFGRSGLSFDAPVVLEKSKDSRASRLLGLEIYRGKSTAIDITCTITDYPGEKEKSLDDVISNHMALVELPSGGDVSRYRIKNTSTAAQQSRRTSATVTRKGRVFYLDVAVIKSGNRIATISVKSDPASVKAQRAVESLFSSIQFD